MNPRRTLLVLLTTVFAVQLLTMPAHLYRGDPYAVRAASVRLLQHGSLAIPADGLPGWIVREPGQYLYEREDGTLRSKYRTLSSLLALPPVAASRLLEGPLDPLHRSVTLLVLLNLWNALFAVLAARHLFRLARVLTTRPWLALAFVLSVFYASFVWYYLRAQTTEVFQIWMFAAFADHLVRGRSRRTDRGLALLYAAGLTLLKPYYLLLFPVAWLGWRRERPALDAPRLPALAGLATLALLLAENMLLFGGPFDFGYGQWQVDGVRRDTFGGSHVLPAIAAFVGSPRHSVFLHLPLFAVACAGLAGAWRRAPSLVVAGWGGLLAVTAVVTTFSNWDGMWCYGPRYLAPLLPVATLPALTMAERRARLDRTGRGLSAAAGAAALIALGFFAWLQHQVNRLEFHADFQARGWYRQIEASDAEPYFRRHAPFVFRDLAALRQGERLPFDAGGAGYDDVAAALRHSRYLKSNYFWFAERALPE